MKRLIHNKDNLKDCNISNIAKRSKALIINSNNEILLGYGNYNYQLIGGHLEQYEDYIECLKREIKEETGIDISFIKDDPIMEIIYYNKDYPSLGVNSKYIARYYVVKTDMKPELSSMSLTENELEGMFSIGYYRLDQVMKILKDSLNNATRVGVVIDTIDVISEYLKLL